MKVSKLILLGIVIAIIMAGIFACASQRDTEAFLTSVDVFIQEAGK